MKVLYRPWLDHQGQTWSVYQGKKCLTMKPTARAVMNYLRDEHNIENPKPMLLAAVEADYRKQIEYVNDQ